MTAVVRDTARLSSRPGLTVLQRELSSVDEIIRCIQGTEAVVSAFGPPPNDISQLVVVTERLTQAISKNNGPRLIVVGGAGTLFVAPGITLLDSGYLPAEWVGLAKAHQQVLENLRVSDIDWTSFCPAAYFDPGERTGKFRLGTDTLVADDQNNSRISMEDYAVALVDELETPRHVRARFTIGY